ncbi:hypothetical protein SDC9_95032 [bioreactor metagenome]|uniref:Uncharacterized protein n=1 Tax=bioreactor metagenome TaxID=1076179 RepID=A0A645A6G6_9ZZZZ
MAESEQITINGAVYVHHTARCNDKPVDGAIYVDGFAGDDQIIVHGLIHRQVSLVVNGNCLCFLGGKKAHCKCDQSTK